MKEIKLTQKFTVKLDDNDYEYLNQFKWYIMTNKRNNYAIRFERIKGNCKTILMHRDIIKNVPFHNEVDHIDRNGLNNQRSNLRIVSHSENLKNSRDRNFKKKIGLKQVINHKWVLYLIKDNYYIIIDYYSNKNNAILASKMHRNII